MSGLDGHDRTISQLFFVLLDNRITDCALALRRYPDQSYDPGMRVTMDDGQLSKILIERDENSALGVGLGNDFVVARIRSGYANLLCVVS
jgi:hypothetical protein